LKETSRKEAIPMSHRTRTFHCPALLPALLALLSAGVRADAFLEESYDLVAGWNLIHVPVEPVDRDPLSALAAINWESLWTWLPTEGEPRGGRWLVRYRDTPTFLNSFTEAKGTSSLFSFSGPASYLVLTPSGGTLRVRGVVRAARRPVIGGAFQLFGPSFDATQPPSLASYFSRLGVKEHIGSAFELAGQTYRQVSSGAPLRPNAAYWLFPDQTIPAPDPLRLQSGSSGLRFDAQTSLQEMVLDIGVLDGGGGGGGGVPRELKLRTRPSAGNANPTDWLEVKKLDGTFAAVGAETVLEIAPDQSLVRLEFHAKSDGVAAAGSMDPAAILEVAAPAGGITIGAELDIPGLKGIWIGDASISEVERPSFHGGGFAPATPVTMSLILEIPTAGPARLLSCVTVESSRDGRSASFRLNAVTLKQPVALAGTVAADGRSGTLRGTVVIPADDPLNPYRHRYNPEHILGYEITRSLELSFGADGPNPGPEDPLAAVGMLQGRFEEEIDGLSQELIRVRGSFQLRRLISGTVTPCP
jgi:hypothetical protein